jgi:hypothetical protein
MVIIAIISIMDIMAINNYTLGHFSPGHSYALGKPYGNQGHRYAIICIKFIIAIIEHIGNIDLI